MGLVSWVELMVCWFAWFYPFIFRVPHFQNRESIIDAVPTRIGLLLEGAAIFVAFTCRFSGQQSPGAVRIALSMVLGPCAAILAWKAVSHLGRQFRIHAGLYHDHALIRSGPYALVRHPVYASLFVMLLSTLLLLAPWKIALLSIGLFIAGTEIRVRAEDRLLAARFGGVFAGYRKAVPAYIPFVR